MNFLPGAGRLYEPLWRVHELNLLTGERFPNERETKKISSIAQIDVAAFTSTSAARPVSITVR